MWRMTAFHQTERHPSHASPSNGENCRALSWRYLKISVQITRVKLIKLWMESIGEGKPARMIWLALNNAPPEHFLNTVNLIRVAKRSVFPGQHCDHSVWRDVSIGPCKLFLSFSSMCEVTKLLYWSPDCLFQMFSPVFCCHSKVGFGRECEKGWRGKSNNTKDLVLKQQDIILPYFQ